MQFCQLHQKSRLRTHCLASGGLKLTALRAAGCGITGRGHLQCIFRAPCGARFTRLPLVIPGSDWAATELR